VLARALVGAGARVTCVLTEAATRFVGPETFSGLTGIPALSSLWEQPGEVIHVRLAHETDVAIVAPCTADVLAKLANGFADDLLTSTLLEYAGPLVIAPAMHTGMWSNPATQNNVRTLAASLGDRLTLVGPVVGALAHGDEGIGRMSEAEEIVAAARRASGRHDLEGRSVLVTAGPTYEPIDAVRFLGNRSTGKMGVAIAAEAWARGAMVTLVLGPGTIQPPFGIEVVHAHTAQEMHDEVLARFATSDAVVMAAAVADFRPKEVAPGKLKKDDGVPELVLEPTPDIALELGERKRAGQVIVGFAAETGDLEDAGRAKLRRKKLDLLVANLVGSEGTGFGADTNDAAIVSAKGEDVPRRSWTKADLARAICDRLVLQLGS
jgi:phosphopantothenoylcysteine decarboxylase/phosphopantothenate--cysteine ligase